MSPFFVFFFFFFLSFQPTFATPQPERSHTTNQMASSCATLRDVLSASFAKWGDKTAFVSPHEERTLTYAELDARSNQLANALRRELKVGKQEPVGIMSTNSHRSLELYIACAKLGTINSSIGHMMMPPEIPPVINAVGPRVLFFGPSVSEKLASIRNQLTTVEHCIAFGAAYEELLARHSSVLDDPPAVVPEDIFATFLTSGTTGNPKAVMRSHRNLVAVSLPDFDASCIVLYNDYAWIGATLVTFIVLRAGGRIVSVPRYDRDEYHRLIVEHRPSSLFLLPGPFRDLLEAPQATIDTLKELKPIMGYGGGKIPPPLIVRLVQMFPGLPFLQGYGQTESGSIAVLGPADHKANPTPEELAIMDSAGKPPPNSEVIVVDPVTSEPKAVNEQGEVLVKSEANMVGYFNNPEATKQAFFGEFLRTGDVGYFDGQGYLHICSRVKDMIVLAAGINVFPMELETVVEQAFPDDVSDVTVVGAPHPADVGERIVMFVVRKPGSLITDAVIKENLAARLAAFKLPHLILFKDSLPYNPNGKCLKRQLLIENLQLINADLLG